MFTCFINTFVLRERRRRKKNTVLYTIYVFRHFDEIHSVNKIINTSFGSFIIIIIVYFNSYSLTQRYVRYQHHDTHTRVTPYTNTQHPKNIQTVND